SAMRFGELAPQLHAQGRALRNMGSLPHISIAGAAATGTHGSGIRNQSLSASVAALELVTADGARQRYDRSHGDFPGLAVALGAVGVVTKVELDTVPAYDLHQTVYDGIPFAAAAEHATGMLAAGYSVSLFTDWDIAAAWVKDRRPNPADFFGFSAADGARHPIPSAPATHCTAQGGVPGPWFERLPHFRLDFTPSAGRELQTEYFVDAAAAREALQAVHAIRDLVQPVLQISEIRTVAADDLWLSPAYHRDSVALHFTWIEDTDAVLPVVRAVEDALAPFEPRPHWGKVFTMDPGLVRSRYPRFDDFLALAERLDPHAKFRNDFLVPYFV
ncbi:MAG: D-arabinono-1,4-lactone oxidase, partial [Actinomycetales bacterium]